MTDQLRQILTANCDSAYESGDPKRIADAERAMSKALAECQSHTADRVKRIEARVEKMDATLDGINLQITEIATSRAVLTEKYDATVEALKDMQLGLAELKGSNKPQTQSKWLQSIMNPMTMMFVLTLLLIWAFIYAFTGQNGVEAVKDGATHTLTGGVK